MAPGVASPSHVATLDITDFYNQIYHHTVENQLIDSGVSNSYKKALVSLLETASDGVSRGLPTGPHGSNLLAEIVLIPLDNFLVLNGLSFCRYVDDIHIFCESHADAQNAIFQVADFLDKTQKLSLNKQKTSILNGSDFRAKAELMLVITPSTMKKPKFSRS